MKLSLENVCFVRNTKSVINEGEPNPRSLGVLVVLFFVLPDRVSLSSRPDIMSSRMAGLELRDPLPLPSDCHRALQAQVSNAKQLLQERGAQNHPSQNGATALCSASKMKSVSHLRSSQLQNLYTVLEQILSPTAAGLLEGKRPSEIAVGQPSGDGCPCGFIDFCGKGVCDLSWKYLRSKERSLGVW